jgi:hypothetical protein
LEAEVVSVGSPPPTRITLLPLRTARVVIRWSEPTEASTATEVINLVVEAGTAGRSALLLNSGLWVMASMTVPFRSAPSPEARIGPASRAASEPADGSGAVAATGASAGEPAGTIVRPATVGGLSARERSGVSLTTASAAVTRKTFSSASVIMATARSGLRTLTPLSSPQY